MALEVADEVVAGVLEGDAELQPASAKAAMQVTADRINRCFGVCIKTA